jgi:hypothetical protein
MTAAPVAATRPFRRWRKALTIENISVGIASLALLLALLHLIWAIGSAGPTAINQIWVNSDTLYPVNVTTDVVKDGYPFSGWRFSIAPCWFPDLFTTGLIWLVTRNPILATLLAGFIQLPLIVGAFYLVHRAIRLGSGSLQTVSLLGVSIALTLYVAARPGLGYPDLYRLFIPQSHIGSLIMSLYALALGLLLLKQAHEASSIARSTAIAYGGVCLLAGMSNLMFFPQMLAPLTAAIAGCVFLNVLSASRSWAPVAIGWPTAIAGAIFNRVLFHTTPISAQSRISFDAALTALDVFMRGVTAHILEPWHLLAALWLFVCLIVVAVVVRKLTGGEQALNLRVRLLCLFCGCWLFSDVFSAASQIIGGSLGLTVLKDYIWTTHYLQSIFFIPIFGLPLIIVWLMSRRIPSRVMQAGTLSGALIILVIAAARLGATSLPKTTITRYRPPLVRFLDDLASRHGLKYGLAGYWQARVATLLSHTGLRVYAVDASFNPFLWVSNIHWYTEALDDRTKAPSFRFVVLDDPAFKLSRQHAVQVFGSPSDEGRFENTRVLIYSSAGMAWDPVLRCISEPLAQFNEEITSTVGELHARPGIRIRVPVRIRNPTSESWASCGKYPINVSYRWLDSDSGHMLNIEGERTILPRQVRPGGEISLEADVAVPNQNGNLTLKISLVQEGVAWFFTRGAATLDLPVNVMAEERSRATNYGAK